MRITPLKAIRKKCIDCSGYELKRVSECPFDGVKEEKCVLYPLRMGRGSRSTLRPIRAYCIWCMNGQRGEVRLCPSVDCSLWEYRFGRRPQKSISMPEIVTTEGVLGTEIVQR